MCVNVRVWPLSILPELHPGASSLETRTGIFSKSVTLWTPIQTNLRYLDASGSGMTPSDLSKNHLLIHLRLSDCRIDTQPILMLPNLRHLDLSGNGLTRIDIQHFLSLKNLRVLVLSGNPLSAIPNTAPSGPSDHRLIGYQSRCLQR